MTFMPLFWVRRKPVFRLSAKADNGKNLTFAIKHGKTGFRIMKDAAHE